MVENPIKFFNEIFDFLGLTMDERMTKQIQCYTDPGSCSSDWKGQRSKKFSPKALKLKGQSPKKFSPTELKLKGQSPKKVGPHEIKRNSNSTLNEWKEGLSWPEIQDIQEQCKDAMKLWGYELISAQEELRNTSSIFKEWTEQ